MGGRCDGIPLLYHAGFPLSRLTPSSGRPKNPPFGMFVGSGGAGGGDKEPSPAYYPGTEISGYMPHRGDFARVGG